MATVNFYAAARAASGVSEAEIAGEKLGDVVVTATELYPKLQVILAGLSQVDDCHEKTCAGGLGYFPCLEETGRNLLQRACLLNFTCENRESRPSKP